MIPYEWTNVENLAKETCLQSRRTKSEGNVGGQTFIWISENNLTDDNRTKRLESKRKEPPCTEWYVAWSEETDSELTIISLSDLMRGLGLKCEFNMEPPARLEALRRVTSKFSKRYFHRLDVELEVLRLIFFLILSDPDSRESKEKTFKGKTF